jgi:gliding motility-associated-like protein
MDTDSIYLAYFVDGDIDIGMDSTLCIGNEIILDAGLDDPITYTWQDGSDSSVFVATADGTYWVDAMRDHCLVQDTVVLNFVDSLNIDLGNDSLLCDLGSLALDASSDESEYLWQDGSTLPVLEANEDGLYWVVISNICETESDSIELSFLNSPTVAFGSDTTLCDDAVLSLSSMPDQGTYIWHDGSTETSYTVQEAGVYWLRIDNACGSDADSIAISYDFPLNIYLGEDSILCSYNSLNLTSNITASNYLWQDGSNQATMLVINSGDYWLSIENVCGVFADTIGITIIDPPSIYLGPDELLCPGDSILLSVEAELAEYLWSDFSTGSEFTAYFPEEYWVVVTNQCGTAEDFIEFSCEQVQIPNVFTPNGDGFNDFLLPFTQGDMNQYQFSVFNRWGKELFSTIDRSQGWNGSDSPNGLYFAVVTFIDYQGEKRSYTQDVTLTEN